VGKAIWGEAQKMSEKSADILPKKRIFERAYCQKSKK
jgi:hypothetical protein